MKLSDRIQSIQASQTNELTSLMENLRSQGKPIFNLAVGEPEYDTPQEIIEATKAALDAQKTRYSPVQGIANLKNGIATFYEGYDSKNIIVTNGSKQALYSIFQVICNRSDEVIIPKPCWVSFPEQIKLAGALPIFVETRDHQLDVAAIENAISRKTKAVMINSPNNPTGAVYAEEDLKKVARLSHQHNFFIISDEAYQFFVYDDLAPSSLFDFEDIRDRLIITGSFSKQYHMTGFRVGYIAASIEIVNALSKLQSHLSGNVCTFVQYGALAAIVNENGIFERHRKELEEKRDVAYRRASNLFECIKPQGAFYVFPNISKWLKKGESSSDFAAGLLQKTGVAVVPGEAFGMPGYLRISYAVPQQTLIEGFKRIAEVI